MGDTWFAPTISWEWSGPQVGEGTPADLVKEFDSTWGSMTGSFSPGKPMVILDSVAKSVMMVFDLVIDINASGKAPTCLMDNKPVAFTLTFDDDMKVTKWDGFWDPNEPTLVECIGKLQGEL